MRLVLSEYIQSLKEDRELDRLIVDILKNKGTAIVSGPEHGRQYGVDIYAMGKDPDDRNRKKVFLVVVKQGDLDRKNWDTEINSIRQSLEEIKDVFVTNNLLPQHKKLPIKITVAFNGMLKPTLQQNWAGYVSSNTGFEYELWDNGCLVEQVEKYLLNEYSFPGEIQSLVRKTIIYLENPDYDLKHFTELLTVYSSRLSKAGKLKSKFKILKELKTCVAVIQKYCESSDNLHHSVNVVEKYLLFLSSELLFDKVAEPNAAAMIEALGTARKTYLAYFKKLQPLAQIRDGLSIGILDTVSYTDVVYRQVGILAMAGLITCQLYELFKSSIGLAINELHETFSNEASIIALNLSELINNNPVFFVPRADDHHIEISLLFILLCKLQRKDYVGNFLGHFCKTIAEAKAIQNIFPEFRNDKRKIVELDVDAEKRQAYRYKSSTLYTILVEWCVVIGDSNTYARFKKVKELHLADLDLILWFPDQQTGQHLSTSGARSKTGYDLSNIQIPEAMAECEKTIRDELENDCAENEFVFIRYGFWSIGLVSARHHRNYIFPWYWRKLIAVMQAV